MDAAVHVRLDQGLKRKIAARAKGQHRSEGEQVRRYLEIAMIAEENPDLPFRFIGEILQGLAEVEAGLTEPIDWSISDEQHALDR